MPQQPQPLAPHQPGSALHWQSQTVLLAVLAPAVFYALFSAAAMPRAALLAALALCAAFAALVYLLRAAGAPAALLGALLMFCMAAMPSYPHSALWLLFATLLLTLGAGRVGRTRKLAAAPWERHARTAAQVAANLGAAALCGTVLNAKGSIAAHTAMAAALAETTADTLASELGRLAPGRPRMLFGGRRVEPGTDGAISLPGCAAGLAGAAIVCSVARWAFELPLGLTVLAAAAGLCGFLLDSALGQLAERRGLLNNDAVNFLSNASALLLALWLARAD